MPKKAVLNFPQMSHVSLSSSSYTLHVPFSRNHNKFPTREMCAGEKVFLRQEESKLHQKSFIWCAGNYRTIASTTCSSAHWFRSLRFILIRSYFEHVNRSVNKVIREIFPEDKQIKSSIKSAAGFLTYVFYFARQCQSLPYNGSICMSLWDKSGLWCWWCRC